MFSKFIIKRLDSCFGFGMNSLCPTKQTNYPMNLSVVLVGYIQLLGSVALDISIGNIMSKSKHTAWC